MSSDISIFVTDGPVKLTLFRAPGDAPRPAALMLHGAQTFGPRLADYRRYASAIAIEGIDTYLVHYYSQLDYVTVRTGQNLMMTRLEAWTKMISEIAGTIAKNKDATGKVGLIGFSNGGVLAVSACATDPRFDAAVIYYGGIPSKLKDIRHLPPLLILHGKNDRVIPVVAGKNLATLAARLDGTGEFVTYEDADHGFAIDRTVPAIDAMARTIKFLKRELKVS
jgi:carboxymethylenebutenolidase